MKIETAKKEIADGLNGLRSMSHLDLSEICRKSGLDFGDQDKSFKEAVKSGTHTELYLGNPACLAYIPRTRAFGFGG